MAANPRSIDLRWAEIRPILERVLELPPAVREEFLRRACGPDAGLRQHLEELLAAEPREDFLLAPPARDVLEVLDAYAESGDSESRSFDLLERLASHPTPTGRYRAVREIGRGGVGQVLQVWDEELRRKLAKKVLKPRGVEDGGRAVEPREQARFLEEAQIAASSSTRAACRSTSWASTRMDCSTTRCRWCAARTWAPCTNMCTTARTAGT